jgi:N-acetyl-gamma-glutamyl-phosphate reductase
MEKVKVGIIGHTGRLGWPLFEIMQKHPFAEIVYTESTSAGKRGKPANADVIFLALPPGEGKYYTRRLSEKKLIDLSIDHRHNHHWIYGLPEIFRGEIKAAKRIANPGCYATSIVLGLFPLKGKLVQANISSTSGISGAGMQIAKEDNFLVYKEGKKHPQIEEMARVLKTDDILFVPQRIDTADRGIVSTIFV